MNKIKKFKRLLDEGKTKEEAMNESGVAPGTARVQYGKWNKEKKAYEETVGVTTASSKGAPFLKKEESEEEITYEKEDE